MRNCSEGRELAPLFLGETLVNFLHTCIHTSDRNGDLGRQSKLYMATYT